MNSMYEAENRFDGFAADASLEHRIGFIRRVYGHMLGATLLFDGVGHGWPLRGADGRP